MTTRGGNFQCPPSERLSADVGEVGIVAIANNRLLRSSRLERIAAIEMGRHLKQRARGVDSCFG